MHELLKPLLDCKQFIVDERWTLFNIRNGFLWRLYELRVQLRNKIKILKRDHYVQIYVHVLFANKHMTHNDLKQYIFPT